MNQSSVKPMVIAWLPFVSVGLLVAWLTGRLAVHYVPDSYSYLNFTFSSLDEICRATRTPLYPLWLRLFEQSVGIQFVPVGQVAIHATAVGWLFHELRSWEMSWRASLAAAIAIGLGCTASDHIQTVSTDTMGASFGILSATALLRWSRCDGKKLDWLLVLTMVTVAIFIRPAYLFLIPWVMIAGVMLRRLKQDVWWRAIRRGFMLMLLTALPLVGWMTTRFAVVGDFGVLPFGHQNLAGILVQLLSEDELNELDSEFGPAINRKRIQHEETIGFAAGEAGATMTIDRRWDDMTYHVVVAAAIDTYGEDTVTYHSKIAEMNAAIIVRYPLRYLTWLAKSARRGAWAIAADIVMHPIFLAAISIVILLLLRSSMTGSVAYVQWPSTDALRALTLVTWSYLIAKVGFVILTSPPIGRFSDAAAIFVPAWIAAVYFSRQRSDFPEIRAGDANANC